ncbi:MAG: glutamine amidotransferase [Gammaproteobacteria bacterium RIFCSPLOWO2_12_FULL_38_14]|nr:MAG: glutamine amidotransferase [Gammaproteobacteria bacterium RIFCSPHIGHO2_12_38_15]OGT75380.1 MAG: glutamine amidotransferase [Gammaproteobacteria bacterium RIFCSPLOWO2_12_FULL_38_14]
MLNATIIRHIAFEDLGVFSECLLDAGYQLNYLEAGVDDLFSIERINPELLIILGGPLNANDQDRYPFLKDEIHILKKRIQARKPTLGICLGAQLIALVLGAKVTQGKSKEIGWSKLSLTEEGKKNYFKYLESTPVFHWHGDTFSLPDKSILCASTPICNNQAFIYDNFTLGIQFHPEVDGEELEKWFIAYVSELDLENISLHQLRKDTKKYAKQLNTQAKKFMTGWLADMLARQIK